jgi:Endonuclease/Exonuclease/phosphatase family.
MLNQSLVNKMDEIKQMIDTEKPHLILICESWLNKSIPDSIVNIDNYSFIIIRKDRINKKGGGLCIYVIKKCDKFKIIYEESNTTCIGDAEILVIKSKFNQKDILIGCVYRPPNCSENHTNELISAMKEVVENTAHPILFFGDFNLPGIKWDNDIYKCTSPTEELFADSMLKWVYHNALLNQHVSNLLLYHHCWIPLLQMNLIW